MGSDFTILRDKGFTVEARAELEVVHRLYRANCAEWEFFRTAYLGGREWEEAGLLYRYLNETAPQLAERLKQTPLENHCKSVVHTYSGFVWRVPPKRSFGGLEGNRAALALHVNADKEGASLNEFMKGVQLWASVFGTTWVVMDKPAVVHYNTKPLERGVAVSDLQDVARMQRSMYNDLSELPQMVRGSNHKTLVKNKGDDASTGAGGVIVMHEDTLPEKKPYLLQADAEALLGLLQAMEMKVEMINRMAHLTPVRTYRSMAASGVAIETEFQILNTLLAEKAAQLALTENQLFRIFCRWEGVDYDAANVVVTYPQRFELRDRRADLDFLVRATVVTATIGSPALQREIDRQLARVVLEVV